MKKLNNNFSWCRHAWEYNEIKNSITSNIGGIFRITTTNGASFITENGDEIHLNWGKFSDVCFDDR